MLLENQTSSPGAVPPGAALLVTRLAQMLETARANADTHYDVTKRLVAEAGYAKGVDVELVLRRGPLYEPGALSRQDDLKKVGINLKITLPDTAAFRDRTEKGDFQAYTVLSGVAVDDPDLY